MSELEYGVVAAVEKERGFYRALVDFAKTNPISTVNFLGPMFGGILLLIYYGSISYLPKLDFGMAMLLLVVSAMTGLVFSLSLCVMLFSPALVMHVPLSATIDKKHKEDILEKQPKWFFLFTLITFAIFIAYFVAEYFSYFDEKGLLYFALSLFVILVTGFLYILWAYPRGLKVELLLKLVCSTVAVVFPMLVIMKFIDVGGYKAIWLSVGLVALVLTFNALSLFTRVTKPMAFSLACALLFVLCASNPTLLPNKIVELCKFGNYSVDELYVDKKFCARGTFEPLVQQGLHQQWLIFPPEKVVRVGQDECVLKNVRVLSSLGSEYYLQLPRAGGGSLNVVVPSAMISGWLVHEIKKQNHDNT